MNDEIDDQMDELEDESFDDTKFYMRFKESLFRDESKLQGSTL